MAANQNDYFRKTGANTVTTLAAPGKALAASSITVGSTANYPSDTGIIIGIRQVDSDGVLVPGTYSEWKATVTSGTTFSISTTPVLGSDQVYPAGSTTQVFLPVSSSAHNDLIDGLLEEHNQDGTLKAGAVDNAGVLASNVVETAKIKDGAITTPKLADGAVTAGKIGTDASFASIDFSGTSTIVGWSSFITKVLQYWRIGRFVYVYFNIEGTSNSTSASFTLPIAPKTSTNIEFAYSLAIDNGTVSSYVNRAYSSSSTVTLSKSVNVNWTASGTKVVRGQFFYESN